MKTMCVDILPTIFEIGSDWWNGVNMILSGDLVWGWMCLLMTTLPGCVEGVWVFLSNRTVGGFLYGLVAALFGWLWTPISTMIG